MFDFCELDLYRIRHLDAKASASGVGPTKSQNTGLLVCKAAISHRSIRINTKLNPLMSRFLLQRGFIEFLGYWPFMVGYLVISLFFQSCDERTSAPGTVFSDCFRASGLCASLGSAPKAQKDRSPTPQGLRRGQVIRLYQTLTRARQSAATAAWADRR